MGIDLTSVAALVKLTGFGAIIFVIWLVTLRFFDTILKQQKELFQSVISQQGQRGEENIAVLKQILEQQKELFSSIVKEQSLRASENFQTLNKFAESVEFMGGQIANLCGKIETNMNCPLVRKQIKSE